MKNIRTVDQWVRALGAILLLEWGYFWLAGPSRWATFCAAAVLLLTASLRFCPLYRLVGIAQLPPGHKLPGKLAAALMTLVLVSAALGGSYARLFLSRRWFMEDFNAMNHFYKQTLFLTGKNERSQANANYDRWRAAFGSFSAKYADYRPWALRGDARFDSDLRDVGSMLAQAEPLVRTGDLHLAHLELEKVRPVFQEIFKRNGFSLLSVALVDFHDAMEVILEAATVGDSTRIASAYSIAHDKLRAVEVEANDAEIQQIRINLDNLQSLAQEGNTADLKTTADSLKSSFVKVYLTRG